MWDWLQQFLKSFSGGSPIAGPALPGTTPAAGMPGGLAAPGMLAKGLSTGMNVLGQAGQGAIDINSIMSLLKPQPMQAAPIAQPGQTSPFQSSPLHPSPVQSGSDSLGGLGGNNQLMMLLQKLLGGH